jgi:hypothetical protein
MLPLSVLSDEAVTPATSDLPSRAAMRFTPPLRHEPDDHSRVLGFAART